MIGKKDDAATCFKELNNMLEMKNMMATTNSNNAMWV